MFNKLAIAVLKVIGVHCCLYVDTFVLQCLLLFSEAQFDNIEMTDCYCLTNWR